MHESEKWKVKVKSLSRVWLFTTPWTAAHQAPPSMGFSRQEYWSGVPSPSPTPSLLWGYCYVFNSTYNKNLAWYIFCFILSISVQIHPYIYPFCYASFFPTFLYFHLGSFFLMVEEHLLVLSLLLLNSLSLFVWKHLYLTFSFNYFFFFTGCIHLGLQVFLTAFKKCHLIFWLPFQLLVLLFLLTCFFLTAFKIFFVFGGQEFIYDVPR